MAAGSDDSSASREALATLCHIYWYPVYAFVRRQGRTPEDACDLTQSYFALLIERRDFEELREDRGRFRSFLLASLGHFLANDGVRRRALKRGGGVATLPLALDGAEGRYRCEPVEPATPEMIFERRWALDAAGARSDRCAGCAGGLRGMDDSGAGTRAGRPGHRHLGCAAMKC